MNIITYHILTILSRVLSPLFYIIHKKLFLAEIKEKWIKKTATIEVAV